MNLRKQYLYEAIMITFIFITFFSYAEGQDLSSTDGWKGKYEYAANYGRTSGGTSIIIDYAIDVTSSNASLGATIAKEGYMTSQEIRCDTKTEGDSINFYFNSFPDGGTKNQFDVEVYKKGELLLSMQKIIVKQQTKYLVTLLPNYTADRKEKKAYFKKVKSFKTY